MIFEVFIAVKILVFGV